MSAQLTRLLTSSYLHYCKLLKRAPAVYKIHLTSTSLISREILLLPDLVAWNPNAALLHKCAIPCSHNTPCHSPYPFVFTLYHTNLRHALTAHHVALLHDSHCSHMYWNSLLLMWLTTNYLSRHFLLSLKLLTSALRLSLSRATHCKV